MSSKSSKKTPSGKKLAQNAKKLVNAELALVRADEAKDENKKKAQTIRARREVLENKYLASLLDPFYIRGAKIPDDLTYSSTTFFVHERYEATTDVNGNWCGMFTPWHENLVMANGTTFLGGSGALYAWSTNSWLAASKLATIGSTYAMVRPVSMGVRVRYTGSVLNAAGEITGALYDPNTTLPSSYSNLLTAPEYTTFSISGESASAEFLWKPLCAAQSRDYQPVGWRVAPQSTYGFLWPTAAGTNTAYFTSGSWAYLPTGASVFQRMGPLGFPVLVIGGTGHPVQSTCFKIELIVHFEATIQSQNLAMGAISPSPSTYDPSKLHIADAVIAQSPVGRPMDDKGPSWVERANSALRGVGAVASTAFEVGKTVAPLLAALI